MRGAGAKHPPVASPQAPATPASAAVAAAAAGGEAGVGGRHARRGDGRQQAGSRQQVGHVPRADVLAVLHACPVLMGECRALVWLGIGVGWGLCSRCCCGSLATAEGAE